jgi:glutamate/tyrosine decarboxylase-like PLP-dependent enzyme
MKSIPREGKPRKNILDKLAEFKKYDADHAGARTWSLVYHLSREHDEFLKKAHNMFFCENALNPMAFQSLKRFEHEVVQMTAKLLNADDNAAGTMTSGGTESCLLPVLTYREMAKSKRRIRSFYPEMIAPESIHVAWDKAAKYFGVKIVKIPLKHDFTMDTAKLKKRINANTIMIVASAPSYPHGIIDPIEKIGAIAFENKIPFHVDSCLGGFFLPFMEQLGYPLPEFDFRIKGVTSMSADVHKYGFGAKGASVLVYRDIKYMRHQFFIHSDWPGGVFASPALLGTRPGGPIAAAWAAMNRIGLKGYCKMTGQVMTVTRRLIRGINAINGLEVMGNPKMSVFAYGSNDPELNIFAVGDIMEEKGWHIDRLQKPEGLHAMVTPAHAEVADQYLEDLNHSVEHVRKNPGLAGRGNAAMYGMIANIPFRGMIKKQVMKMMEKMYGPECEMPLDSNDGQPLSVKLGAGLMNRLRRF